MDMQRMGYHPIKFVGCTGAVTMVHFFLINGAKKGKPCTLPELVSRRRVGVNTVFDVAQPVAAVGE
jgi:hypothetical protein